MSTAAPLGGEDSSARERVVLLASEHTEFDAGAERLAIGLAKRDGVPLHGVRVVVTNEEFETTAPELALKADVAAGEAVAGLSAAVEAAGVVPMIRVRRGADPWREIVDEAADQHADLLVIRRRGRRAVFANLLVGDMVQKVIAHAPCNALVVPRAAPMWTRRILAAIDGSAIGENVVAAAVAEARRAQLPVTVVSVSGSDRERHARAESAVARSVAVAREAGIEADGRVITGKIFSAILDFARQAEADLLVLGWNGEHAVRYAVLGGTTQKVVGLADCAVLVVRR